MVLIFDALLSLLFTAVVSQSMHEVRWLPCKFIDERITIVEEVVNKKKMNLTETKHRPRNAVVQFGIPGDNPVHSEFITFLVTASKLDMRRHIKGGVDTLECEVRRHRTNGTVRWPSLGAKEDDSWFACTLRHSKGLFVITTFLRHSPTVPNVKHPGFQWIPVADKDVISTTAVMMMWSSTPSVKVNLNSGQTLDCKFAVDHKAAHLTVEWHMQVGQHLGHYSRLFSYSSQTGKSEGSGVSVKAIGRGDASLNISQINKNSEGTYFCSVKVPPLSGSHIIPLNVMEPPRVSLNVNSEVSLTEGELERVDCEAKGFYPLDVHVIWLKASLNPVHRLHSPQVLNTRGIVHHTSHHQDPDGTYSVITYFLLKPSLQDSGYLYTCSVSHDALDEPILKSFTLSVTGKDLYLWYIPPLLAILGIVYFVWSRRQTAPKGYSRLPGPETVR